MDDATLTRLLRLVDEPAPDPAPFKAALRSELRQTLERRPSTGATAATPELTIAPAGPRRATGRWIRPLLAAAASVALVVGGLVVVIGDGGSRAPNASVAPTAAPMSTVATPAASIESACAAYDAVATPFAELEGFAARSEAPDAPSASAPPDLAGTAAALAGLRDALVGADLVDAPAARSLGLAAGAMAQAVAQLDGGDVTAAARSVGAALQDVRNLGDPPRPVDLPGCGFP